MMERDERIDQESEARVIHLPARRRGWKRWVAPLCLLATVSAGFAVRLTLDDWRGVSPLLRALRPATPRVVRRAPLTPVERLEPVLAPPPARPEARPLRPAMTTATAPIPARRPSPDLIPPPDHPDLAAALAEREIAAEAIRLRAEQAQVALLREQQPKIDEVRQKALRFARIRRAIVEAEAERAAFHGEVAAILDTHGARSGPKLMELMAKQSATALPEIADAAAIALQRRPGSTISSKKIVMLRSLGVPEPLILHDLVRMETKRIPARNGPKSVEEALVRAAKKLRAFPPGPRQTVARPPVQPDPAMRQ